MFWQKIRKGVWYCNTTRIFSFSKLLVTLLIPGKKIFVKNLSILSEYSSLWTQECDYFWLNYFYATESCEKGDTLLLLRQRCWGLISSQRLCKRGNRIFLLVCWEESIKEIYLIASWKAQFSIHFLDGRGWMVVQITLLHLQEVICLSAAEKIILL